MSVQVGRVLRVLLVALSVASCGGGGSSGGGGAPPELPAERPVLLAGLRSTFASPGFVAVHSDGTVYVSDFEANAIYRTTPAGVTSVFAGQPGVAGVEDGQGTQARFNKPMGLGVDSAGNVFVADQSSHTVRRITPDGHVSTWAGAAMEMGHVDGPAPQARLGLPMGVAVGPDDTVYLGQQSNGAVRAISPAGVVRTLGAVSGNWPSFPQGIAVARNGQLYVIDGSRVLNYSVADNLFGYVALINAPITSVGLAVDAQGELVASGYQRGNEGAPAGRVYRYRNGEWLVVAGSGLSGDDNGSATMASFRVPYGVAVGPTGDIMVADPETSAVRRIDTAGNVSHLAGTVSSRGFANGMGDAARFNHPWDLVHDRAGGGTLFVTDFYNNAVRTVTIDGGQVGTFPNHGPGLPLLDHPMIYPTGIDYVGNQLTVLSANYAVTQGPSNMTNVSQLAPGHDRFGLIHVLDHVAPFRHFAGGADGNSYYALFNAIFRMPFGSASTPFAGSNFVGVPSALSDVQGMAVDSQGNLYVADHGNNVIRRITPAGLISTFAGVEHLYGHRDGAGHQAAFWGPTKVAVDAADNVYVVHQGPLRRIAQDGTVSTPALAWGTPVLRGVTVVGGYVYGVTADAVIQARLPN